ncbi:glycoside hydrolase family 2 TIM barrel-domain containing protein [Lunatibacter salilacus]|uniref:glycoside hydrolase family 2 TIM barrel-domain containing protein n=1 Tax=Lunatibacter salilacus TaxID=2483804 RepID=UPI00131E9004|nr:glycoside hydrolase family 2 TIM barrel-domain containing protein [Lunatibacter salilacus]
MKFLPFYFCLFLFLGTSSPALAQTEFSLNGTWQFKTDPNNLGESEEWFRSDLIRDGWDNMQVPGNWDLHNEYAHFVGKGWYSKSFTLPSDWDAKAIVLNFEGVYHDCIVWLNGKKLGENNSGFLPFEFEVTSLLEISQENTLTVCADNTFKRGAIWNWGGIRRSVKLSAYNGLRITRQHITPTVSLEKMVAEVSIRLFLENFQSESTIAEGEVLLTSSSGYRQVMPFSTTISPNGKKEVLLNAQIKKKDVHLWHFDDPFLYESAVRFKEQDKPAVSNVFGLRKVEVDAANYKLMLNGESVRLMGLNLVPDARTSGNTLPLWQIKRDVDLLKSLNGNFARLSHLPLPEEMLEYLDQRGILIISEIPLWGYDQLADTENDLPFDWLKRLVTEQYNHPSIVGWSTGNELGYFPSAGDYVEKSIDYVRGLDSTRLVTNVSYTAQFEDDYIRFTDIGLINKYGKNLAPVTRQQHQKHPDKVLFYSEYGIAQFGEGLDATFEIKPLLDSLRHLPYLLGASIWTYNDYRSSYVGTQDLSENRSWGVVDTYRRKKQAYFDLQREHAPVRGMDVDLSDKSALISLLPRALLDLPSHPMRDYKIIYKLLDINENTIGGGFINLPTIIPGDGPIIQTFEWQTANPQVLEVSLVNPQMDKVLDTVVHFQNPPKPELFEAFGGRTQHNNVPSNSGGIRVYLNTVSPTVRYKLKYGKDGLDQETLPSRESFLDVNGLELDQSYKVQVVAITAFGESYSEAIEVEVDQRNFLPPGIRHVEPTNEGFFVAYASEETDFLYRVKYRSESGEEKIIQSRNPGLMAVRGLTNGHTYRFAVQRVLDNNSNSQWSKWYTVKPDGDQNPVAPTLKGIFRNGREVVISFDPVSKATGYEIQYRESGKSSEDWNTFFLNRSEVYFGRIADLKPNRRYDFRMAAINDSGISDFTKIIQQ